MPLPPNSTSSAAANSAAALQCARSTVETYSRLVNCRWQHCVPRNMEFAPAVALALDVGLQHGGTISTSQHGSDLVPHRQIMCPCSPLSCVCSCLTLWPRQTERVSTPEQQ